MMDARLKYFKTVDRINLYYEWWIPAEHKANIIFVHGLGDHIGRYGRMVRWFTERGYGLFLYDQRGHGRSGGRRGHTRSFQDLIRDLAQFIDAVTESSPGKPLFLMGHSLGGQVAINFAAKYSKGLRGLILSSPNIEPIVNIPRWKKKLASHMSKWLPIIKVTSDINPEWFSHDNRIVDAARADPLMNWDVTARMGTEVLVNAAGLTKLAFQIRVPTLILHGSEDRIASVEAARRFYYNMIIQKKEFKVYPTLYHELLNESSCERVYADIESWIVKMMTEQGRIARQEDMYEKSFDKWHRDRDHALDHIE